MFKQTLSSLWRNFRLSRIRSECHVNQLPAPRPKFRCTTNKSDSKQPSRGYANLGFATLSGVALVNPESHLQQQQQQPSQYQLQQQQTNIINPSSIYLDWNTFCFQLLAKGEVAQVVVTPGVNIVQVVLHYGATINGQPLPLKTYFLRVPSPEQFEKKLREFERNLGIKPGYELPIVYQRSSGVGPIIGTLITAGLVYLMFKNTRITGPQNIMSSFSKAKFTLVDPSVRAADSNSIKFKDVAGLHEAKVEIKEFVDYLKDSERFLKLGAKLPKGVLLTGPPGCGKTLLAKAVATEANVPFLALSGSDFVEMIGGVGASRVRSLFKQAKKLAPCIIYIDEIDSIGMKRSGSQFYNGEMEQTLNQLLVEMDGMVARKNVILLASTNRADVLDQALLRPGRFDRQILIDLPNVEERKEIFLKHVSKIKLAGDAKELALRIAHLTPGMSGADLANVCNEAALHAARKDNSFVTASDLEYAIERVIAGAEKKSSSLSTNERKVIAYHESGHALVGWLLEHSDPVLKVSIIQRTKSVLGFAQYAPSDQKLYNQDQFFDRMCMALGGRVAELLKFNHLSTGAQDDLKKVTQMALAQVTEYGFDPVVGHICFPKDEVERLGRRPYSKRLANVIDKRASILVKQAFDRTQQVLSANMDKLTLLAEELLVKDVINTSDIERLIGPRPYPNRKSS